MGKAGKQRGKQNKPGHEKSGSGHQKAFKVTNIKAMKSKNKTKPVSTNLKKLNFQTRSEVSKNDVTYKQLQSELQAAKMIKQTKQTVQKQKLTANKSAEAERPPVDMDTTAKKFSLL